MKATDARKLAQESIRKIASEKVKTILDRIEKGAKTGHFTLTLGEKLSVDERVFLQGLGYKITYIDGDFIEPGYTTISWK